ncbi:MAG: RDD family protein [Planctomycetes bacterium]|nr:RDD family protein [Planctomycetota bacterium]
MLPPAGHFRRILAYLIDVIPLVIGVVIVYLVFFDFGDVVQRRLADRQDPIAHADFIELRNQIRTVSFILVILYGMLMEGSPLQGTLGKAICGIKVVDEDGQRLTFSKAIFRNCSKLLSYLVLFLGFFWAFFNKDHQTWHDKFASTYVVNKK